ncbi:MAG: transcription antitermination factor NusB [Bacilli bacterium]|jgi:N utilization substance protein B|nr:transcription antitermination factor NusB [Bacilli bacterium]
MSDKMKRTIARIVAMMILYHYDLTKELDIDLTMDLIKPEEEYDEVMAKELVDGVIANLRKLDHTISIYLDHYTLDRLSYVDRALIRIGTYELMFTNTPTSIIINEIIEISKEYSEVDDFNTAKFNNSLLDKIAKGLKNGD